MNQFQPPQSPYPQAPVSPPQQAYQPSQGYGYWQPPAPQAPPYAQPTQYQPVWNPAGYAPPQGYYAPPFAVKRGPDPRVSGAAKTMNRMCLVVLLQSVAAYVLEIPLILASTLAGVNVLGDNLAYQLLITAMVPLSTALPFFLYLKTGQRDVSDFLRFEKVGFFTGLLCVLAGLAVCLLGNYPAWIIQELLGNIGYEPAQDLFQNQQTIGFFVLEFLSTAVLVPVMEEFAFRGVLFSVLRKHGTGFAIVASALVFSLVHLDFSNVLFALVAGLVFGFLYARTGNLWVTICIHALNNGIAVVGSYEELLFGNMAETADFLLLIIPLCVGLLALVLLLIFRRKPLFGRREKQLPIQPLGGGESAGAIVRAPLFWILVAMMALYTVSLFF